MRGSFRFGFKVIWHLTQQCGWQQTSRSRRTCFGNSSRRSNGAETSRLAISRTLCRIITEREASRTLDLTRLTRSGCRLGF